MEPAVSVFLTLLVETTHTMNSFFNAYSGHHYAYITTVQAIHRLKYLRNNEALINRYSVNVRALDEHIRHCEDVVDVRRKAFAIVDSMPYDELRKQFGYKSQPWSHVFQNVSYDIDWFGTNTRLVDLLPESDNHTERMHNAYKLAADIEHERVTALNMLLDVKIPEIK